MSAFFATIFEDILAQVGILGMSNLIVCLINVCKKQILGWA